MISAEVRDALESAGSGRVGSGLARPTRSMSADRVREIVVAFIRELPDDMTVAELRDELEISENQATR